MQVNYCQGMNFLAALLLTWLPAPSAAFGGLVVLMHARGLRDLYKSDLKSLQARKACGYWAWALRCSLIDCYCAGTQSLWILGVGSALLTN